MTLPSDFKTVALPEPIAVVVEAVRFDSSELDLLEDVLTIYLGETRFKCHQISDPVRRKGLSKHANDVERMLTDIRTIRGTS